MDSMAGVWSIYRWADIKILPDRDAQIFNSWPEKLRSASPARNPSQASMNLPELCGEHLQNLTGFYFWDLRWSGAPYLMEIYIFPKAWKITPKASKASFKHSFTCHSFDDGKKAPRKMDESEWSEDFFWGNLNSVPSSASASAQFNIHESWSKPPTSHPLSLARQKNGKSEGKVHSMDGVKKRREGKSFSSKWILNRRNT